MANLRGDSKRNVIRGTQRGDSILGLGGDDVLMGLGGDDLLNGGVGDDVLRGGEGSDRLLGGLGDDTLNGGAGDDYMTGGEGDDLYIVNSLGDRVEELENQGIDTVRASVTFTLPTHVENLFLMGLAPINGIGNSMNNAIIGNVAANVLLGLDGDDRLDGGDGADRLDGGAGSDFMAGGAGNDTFVVDRLSDRVLEGSGQGVDTVESFVNFTLAEHLENLVLLGSAVQGIGNDARNVIVGNAANNWLEGMGGADELIGGKGNDTLVGGMGADRFVYTTGRAFVRADIGRDRITSFQRNEDVLVLSKQTFGLSSGLGLGFVRSKEFASVADNTAAATSTAKIVFSRATRTLFYNSNGTAKGFGTGGGFIELPNTTTLAATDFMIEA